MLILVIAALIGGAVGAGIGSGKGAAGEGFLWGLVLGPIGWIIIAVSHGNRLPCPTCREYVHPDATKCPRCASEILRPQPAQMQCRRCGQSYNADLTGCNHCGAAKPRDAGHSRSQ